jgi:hypothetical protein
MAPSRFTNTFSHLKRVAAFVGIVWAVAASFVAFELASLFGFDLLLATGMGRTLALPSAVRDSTACRVNASEHKGSRAERPGDNVDAAAWLLGVKVGMHAHAAVRQNTIEIAREIEQLAAFLQAPRPGPFGGATRADANTAFMLSVEADPDGTARSIAASHAETSCHFYKMGAYWGYAMMVRMALAGERSVFDLEIDYHARKTRLPAEIWEPLIERTRSNATREELVAETMQLTDAVTNHLRSAK